MSLHDRIIEEATKQFFRFGVRNVTMDGIAGELGISKRTVYENFKDKTELIHACLKNLSQQEARRNQEVMDTSENVIDAIFTFMREGIKIMNSISPAFFRDMKKYYKNTWEPFSKANAENTYKLTRQLLEKGITEELFRKDINIAIISKLFYEQMNLIADEKIFPHEEYNHPEVFQNLVIYFLRGISTGKGIEKIDKILEQNKKRKQTA